MKTVFLRVLEAKDKATALLGAVRAPERALGRVRFEVEPASFAIVPRSPFAYWVTDAVRELFRQFVQFGTGHRTVHKGIATSDDFRFLRANWEVSSATRGRWFLFAKGGVFSRYYSDLHLVVNWDSDARELETEILRKYPYLGDNANWLLHRETPYFRPGITWTYATTLPFSTRALPADSFFGHGGPAAFAPLEDLSAILALTNSSMFGFLLKLSVGLAGAGRKNYDIGIIERVPVGSISSDDQRVLSELARRAWYLKRSLDTHTETSHAFVLPALLQVAGGDVATRAAAWSNHVLTMEANLVVIQSEIDERCFALYGIDEADRRTVTEGFGTRDSERASSDGVNDGEHEAVEETDGEEDEPITDATGLAAELVSWAVGVAFGRFDVRLATGARRLPSEPEPFDPLPVCSPGMLTGDDAMPLAGPPTGYPLAFPETGVLIDDLGHAQDLPTAVRAVFDAVFGAGADRWWNDVAALLHPKDHDLRVWLASSFFEHHLKRHSRGRRKAPIVWQLGTPSGRYSVWLYAHRLTRDSFFQLQNDVVGPKLIHEERQFASLMQNAGSSPSALERKEIAAQETVVGELRAMLDEVKRVAPLWNPNLDDGVVLTMAPLWRLLPQYKPWQKELKAKWDELAAGKYDWAHLAMHLWPERVVPKCASDRSLAIAHGLEDVFWVEGADGKWKARTTPVRPVDELVRERSSSAVKAALKSLLDAPTVSGNGRARGRRAASPAATVGGGR